MSCGRYLFEKLYRHMRVLPFCSIVISLGVLVFLYFYSVSLCFSYLSVLCVWQTYAMYKICYYSLIGDRLQTEAERVDYRTLYETTKTSTSLSWEDIKLYYLLPNYKENLEVMKETLRKLSESNYINVRKQVIVVLCMEEREEDSVSKTKALQEYFDGIFSEILVSVHPGNLEGEVTGKGSNMSYACKQVVEPHIDESGCKKENILVMCSDADMLIHPKFVGAIFEKFCNCAPLDRYRRTWGGPLIMDLNLYDIPFITRVMSIMANNTQINFIGDPAEIISQSTFIVSYCAINEVGYWSPKFIAEDYHLYCKSKIKFEGDFSCRLIGLPIRGYSLDSGSYLETLRDRYKQARRHALGMVEIVYVLRKFAKSLYEGKGLIMPIKSLLELLYHLSFHHMILICQFITITIPGTYLFWQNLLGYEDILLNPVGKIYSYINLICLIPFLFAPFVHARYISRKYKHDSQNISVYIANIVWYFVRTAAELVVSAFIGIMAYGVVPTIHEAFLLCFSENFDFFVAGKESNSGVV